MDREYFISKKSFACGAAAMMIAGYAWIATAAAPFAPGATLDPVSDFPADCSGPVDGDCYVATGWEWNHDAGSLTTLYRVGVGVDAPDHDLDVAGDVQIITDLPSGGLALSSQGDLAYLSGDEGLEWLIIDSLAPTRIGSIALDMNGGNPTVATRLDNGSYRVDMVLDSSDGSMNVQADGLISFFTPDDFQAVSDSGSGISSNVAVQTNQVMLGFTNTVNATAGVLGITDNGGNTMSILQTNDNDEHVSFGFTAFPDSATFFRCNETTPTAAPCDDDRAIYVMNDSVDAFIWGDDSIDNNNKNVNGWRIDADAVTLFFEDQVGTPANPGSDTSLTLSNILTLTNAPISVTYPASNGVVASFSNGDGTCTLDPGDAGGWSCPSDERLKQDIDDLPDSLDTILALRPVTYRFVSESSLTEKSAGFIAQEVEEVIPKLVSHSENGMFGLNYAGFVPYLVSGLQELARQVAELATAVQQLHTVVATHQIRTDALCVGDTCLDERQVQGLLQAIQAQQTPNDGGESGDEDGSGEGISNDESDEDPPDISEPGDAPTNDQVPENVPQL